ncbi:hypothetical protein BO79DRAFT_230565 [Aspergillus costaricaensis CBS 115574]|uniref:Uncharacterized protein n=1 Tax=Aspergillus costaricaensis CBS 115574 TaxID=1448317 RepID=A0ACD1I921_9EURO|nr:hypothetical protein BO79DRAFT_230565 [Aspergillus costaricaensis CBS 115574]RAK86511.1 hypothetical protein BO79DRAFT_230565 [Aspergillus costaricaensis CBS 115574]
MSPWVASSGGVMLAQDGHEGSCEQLEIGTSTQERLAARERGISSFSLTVTGSISLPASSKANLRPDRHEQRTTAGHGFPLEGPLFVEMTVRMTVDLSPVLLLITGPAWAVLEATFNLVEHSTGWSRVVRRSSRI